MQLLNMQCQISASIKCTFILFTLALVSAQLNITKWIEDSPENDLHLIAS